MGIAGSAQSVIASGDGVDLSGYQLFVALKMNKLDNQPLPLDLVPHVVGSLPMIGSWDETKAVSHVVSNAQKLQAWDVFM